VFRDLVVNLSDGQGQGKLTYPSDFASFTTVSVCCRWYLYLLILHRQDTSDSAIFSRALRIRLTGNLEVEEGWK